MAKSKLVKVNEKIAENVVGGYKKESRRPSSAGTKRSRTALLVDSTG